MPSDQGVPGMLMRETRGQYHTNESIRVFNLRKTMPVNGGIERLAVVYGDLVEHPS